MASHNEFGQPIGDAVPGWSPRPLPRRTSIEGQYCRLEPLTAELHGPELFAANTSAPDGRAWTYLFEEPFAEQAAFLAYLRKAQASTDPLFFAVVDLQTQRAVALLGLMRMDATHGAIEVGHINYSPLIQRTTAATEAQYLLMKTVFDELGYRRLEWKCDSLNAPSRQAALRLGFTFEGIFRQAVIYKGRSRDTAWFSVIDSEWQHVKAALEAWLSAENFLPDGTQRMALADIRERLVA